MTSKMRSVVAPVVDERYTAASVPLGPSPTVTLFARVSPFTKLRVVGSPVGVIVGPREIRPSAVSPTTVRLPVTAVAFVGTATDLAPTPTTPTTVHVRGVPAVNLPVRPMFVWPEPVGRVSSTRAGLLALNVEPTTVTVPGTTAFDSPEAGPVPTVVTA